MNMPAAAAARAVLLGLALLAATSAHASLSLSASLVSSQTIDGHWLVVAEGFDRYVCAEANNGAFTCLNIQTDPGFQNNVFNYAGALSRSSNPRIYVAGAQAVYTLLPQPKHQDISTYRFILAADGSQMSVCTPRLLDKWYQPGDPPFSCTTWRKLPAPGTTKEGFAFSWQNPIPNMFCVNVNEPNDPAWIDNYFCSNNDIGMKWSANGTIPGMKCTLVDEPEDAQAAAWSNNYICVPSTSNINFVWSNIGYNYYLMCTHWAEPAEVNEGWSYSNFLCY